MCVLDGSIGYTPSELNFRVHIGETVSLPGTYASNNIAC